MILLVISILNALIVVNLQYRLYEKIQLLTKLTN
jgi:hypothetical protein